MKTVDLLVRTNQVPEVCLRLLYDAIDIEKRSIFSLSGYKGDRPVLGVLYPQEFRLQKRRYWRNDFAPVLYGKIFPDGQGTRIEGYFDMRYEVRFFMRCWLIFVAAIGIPISIYAFRDMRSASSESLFAALAPIGMLVFGYLLPKLGSLLSFGERALLSEFMQRTLVAHTIEIENRERNWESSLKW